MMLLIKIPFACLNSCFALSTLKGKYTHTLLKIHLNYPLVHCIFKRMNVVSIFLFADLHLF